MPRHTNPPETDYSNYQPADRPEEVYVSSEELAEANLKTVGDGDRDSAPELPADAWDYYRAKRVTIGVSPKLVAAVVSAVVAYLVTQPLLDLPPAVVLGLQVVSIAIATWAAAPGLVTEEVPTDAP